MSSSCDPSSTGGLSTFSATFSSVAVVDDDATLLLSSAAADKGRLRDDVDDGDGDDGGITTHVLLVWQWMEEAVLEAGTRKAVV